MTHNQYYFAYKISEDNANFDGKTLVDHSLWNFVSTVWMVSVGRLGITNYALQSPVQFVVGCRLKWWREVNCSYTLIRQFHSCLPWNTLFSWTISFVDFMDVLAFQKTSVSLKSSVNSIITWIVDWREN